MQPYMTMHTLDRSGEPSQVSLYTPVVSDANYTDTVALIGDFKTFLDAITLCQITQSDFVTAVFVDAATLPSNPYAQRERRAYFKCRDNVTGRAFTIGVACPDMNDMGIPGTDAIDFNNLEVSAYLAALAADAVSPEGNAFSVVSGYVSGVKS